MTLLHPAWLFLLVPLGLSLYLWRLPSRLLRGLRAAALLLLVLALCGLAVRLPSRAGMVVVVVDRSRSMPPGSDLAGKEAVELLRAHRGPDDRLAVVAFGEKAAVEPVPRTGSFPGFLAEVGGSASNLAEALDEAVSLVPKDGPGKVVVLSDGRWTGSDPAAVTARAAARGVAIDYRPLQRATADDLAVARVEAPPAVAVGEAFLITAWVRSPVAQTASFELTRGGRRIASGEQPLVAGLNRLTFRDRADEAGTQGYDLVVTGRGKDPVPENNRARLLVGVGGPRPVLHVTRSGRSGLARLLEAGGLRLKVRAPEECTWSLEELSRYSAVLLENVPAEKVGGAGMATLAAWVRETGAGLMMTGGRASYGQGGYYRSPLEPVLPVSMELRQEHRKGSLAMVVALDRSGSMAVPVGGGRTKMDLANVGTAQVLDLLGPGDEFGVIAVDTVPHVIADLAPVTDADKGRVRADVLRIQSMGGGIFIYVALEAAAKMILPARAGTKHIILFADANDSEEPGRYEELVTKARAAGITVSVIGLGTPTDKDAELLRDIARRGDGRVFFTDKPEELPRLFAQDTFVVARNTFLDEPTPVRSTPGLGVLTGKAFTPAGDIGGYNLCYLRPGATLATVTLDEYKAPVVAAWQAGAGRVLCYTGEADGRYTGAIARWQGVGDYFTSLARWTAGQPGPLPDRMLLTQEVKNGVNVVRLHLDPDRKGESFSGLPRVTTLRARPGAGPEAKKGALRWSGPDTLEVEVPLRGDETALTTVEVPGQPAVSLPPVCLPYSPEFRPADNDRGLRALERLARATGGKERVELAGVWKELPRYPRWVPSGPWLLGAALVLLLLEVLERRTGLLSRQGLLAAETVQESAARARALFRRRPRPAVVAHTPAPARRPGSREKERGPEAAPAPAPAAVPPAVPGGAPEGPGLLQALQRARQRSRGRTEKDR